MRKQVPNTSINTGWLDESTYRKNTQEQLVADQGMESAAQVRLTTTNTLKEHLSTY